jgi:P-type conjugative transfer ATPase TrbB
MVLLAAQSAPTSKHALILSRQRDNILDLLGEEIGGFLREEDVTDVICNPPLPGEGLCRIWVTRLGRDREPVTTIAPERAHRLICSVAASLGKEATTETPSVEGILITDGSRFQGCIPPIVEAPFFALRRPASAVFPMSQYVAEGKMTDAQKEKIEYAIVNRLNMLIYGGTGDGKTTLLNAIIDGMATLTPTHRFFIIEETPELQCSAPDRTMTRTSATMTIRDLVRVAMRSFADRILIGETRGPEMLDILNAWNTGHEGGAATIHANTRARQREASPTAALERVEDLLLQAGLTNMQRIIVKTVDMVICIQSSQGKRRVTQVASVQGWDGHSYQITQEA